MKEDIKERFWKKVKKEKNCWIWNGERDRGGYGRFVMNKKNRRATHVSWEIENKADFPKNLWALHKCDNPPCVNPDHLFLGTAKDNAIDAFKKGRRTNPTPFKDITHCKRGHEFTPENTGKQKEKYRYCRACDRAAQRTKNGTKKSAYKILSMATLLLMGCATLGDTIPELPNRTLRFSLEKPSLEYQYEQCVKTIWGICVEHGMHVDFYDLTDPIMRKQLIDMGFVAKVREKP